MMLSSASAAGPDAFVNSLLSDSALVPMSSAGGITQPLSAGSISPRASPPLAPLPSLHDVCSPLPANPLLAPPAPAHAFCDPLFAPPVPATQAFLAQAHTSPEALEAMAAVHALHAQPLVKHAAPGKARASKRASLSTSPTPETPAPTRRTRRAKAKKTKAKAATKSRARGRKTKAKAAAKSASNSEDPEDLANLTEEERVLRRRKKNREAAQQSRLRKRLRLEQLEHEVEEHKTRILRAEAERDMVQRENESLHEEVAYLKEILQRSLTIASSMVASDATADASATLMQSILAAAPSN